MIFNVTNNNDYISFDEAVEYLVETYGLSYDDAEYVVEDYIEEASARDMRHAISTGERIYGQRRGKRIRNRELNGRSVIVQNFPYLKHAGEEYLANDKIDLDKVNRVKPKTEKEKVRDATRAGAGIVPKHGANPNRSEHADPKAVRAFHRATDRNRYKKHDIDATAKQFEPTKTYGKDEEIPIEDKVKMTKGRMIRDRMERGEKLPESITRRLVKKNESVPKGKKIKASSKVGLGTKYPISTYMYDDPKEHRKQAERLKTAMQTVDPTAYHMARKEFLKNMGEKDYKDAIMYPISVKNRKTGKLGIQFAKAPREQELRSKEDRQEEYEHLSGSKDMKAAAPSPVAGEGILFPGPRLYGSKGELTGRNGRPLNKDDKNREARMGRAYRFKLSDKDKEKLYKDNLTNSDKYASFIKGGREIPVTHIEPEK